MRENREPVNALDAHNGNHADNMIHNLGLIAQTLQAQSAEPPAEALRGAAGTLQADGLGSTSQHYARGLQQAAAQFQGQDSLDNDDVMRLVQSLLSAVPAQGGAASQPPSGSDEALLASLLGGQTPGAQPGAAPQAPASGNVLEMLLGLAGAAGGQATHAGPARNEPGLDAGDLLAAGMAFLNARQAGTGAPAAAVQAAMGALMGTNPVQTQSPRAAAGGVIAQAILKALAGRR